ncbi:CheY-like chemotaxis protein [Bosea sp. OAE506]|jgi:CheY-like chemotaxis protein|uniref:response regulator n=1 Tax=Bosea sp. OAE506 TaxID=2663870 RepID=UPI001789C33F
MPTKVLIVEDEVLIAMETEAIVEDLGHYPVGIAATSQEALALAAAEEPDVALVDVNLADGPTGPEVGARLAELGIAVVFITANPRMLQNRIENAIGVFDKPVADRDLAELLEYVTSRAAGRPAAPPSRLTVF